MHSHDLTAHPSSKQGFRSGQKLEINPLTNLQVWGSMVFKFARPEHVPNSWFTTLKSHKKLLITVEITIMSSFISPWKCLARLHEYEDKIVRNKGVKISLKTKFS